MTRPSGRAVSRRAAYKIREGGPHERGLSFVAMRWRNRRRLGANDAHRSRRRPRAAAWTACRAACLQESRHRPQAGRDRTGGRRQGRCAGGVLVGDEPYYGPLGFKQIPRGQISMPRPVDLDRLLRSKSCPARWRGSHRRGLPCRPCQDGEHVAARPDPAVASLGRLRSIDPEETGGRQHESEWPDCDRHRRRLRPWRGDSARPGRERREGRHLRSRHGACREGGGRHWRHRHEMRCGERRQR